MRPVRLRGHRARDRVRAGGGGCGPHRIGDGRNAEKAGEAEAGGAGGAAAHREGSGLAKGDASPALDAVGLPRGRAGLAASRALLQGGRRLERSPFGHGGQHGPLAVPPRVPGHRAVARGRLGHEDGGVGGVHARAAGEVRRDLLHTWEPRALGREEGGAQLGAQIRSDLGALREARRAHAPRVHQRGLRDLPFVLMVQGQPVRRVLQGQVQRPVRYPDVLAVVGHGLRRHERRAAIRDCRFLRWAQRAKVGVPAQRGAGGGRRRGRDGRSEGAIGDHHEPLRPPARVLSWAAAALRGHGLSGDRAAGAARRGPHAHLRPLPHRLRPRGGRGALCATPIGLPERLPP
mmetsp:Transcript_7640/g.22564  ORF Transcript_7640/g.22564 Transcript_7640/m.22564 type:complete len:347 (-) Transcript_7640:887-1927(-)